MSDNKILEEISKEHQLKHVETVDKAAPLIDKDVKIGKNPLPDVLEALKSADPATLRHAETVDKSAPHIEKDTHIGQNPRAAVFSEIQKRASQE